MDISWNISIDGAVEYQVYIESETIDSIENLTALTIIPHTTTAPTMMLNTTALGITTIDNDGTYVAVVAFDSYGNATTEFSMVGPVVSLNNSLRSAELTYDLSTTGSSENDGFGLSALDSVYLNITLASGDSLLAGESLELRLKPQQPASPFPVPLMQMVSGRQLRLRTSPNSERHLPRSLTMQASPSTTLETLEMPPRNQLGRLRLRLRVQVCFELQ